jgi:serine/threonine-protein kinase
VPASGIPAPLDLAEKSITPFSFGDVLPDGTALLFNDFHATFEGTRIAVVSLATSETKVLLEGGRFPKYASTGHILFDTGDALMAAPFDPKSLEVRGPAIPVIRDLGVWRLGDGSRFDVSKDGTLVYLSRVSASEKVSLSWVDRGGAAMRVMTEEVLDFYLHPRISPDGRRMALSTGDWDIWVIDLFRDTMTRLTFGEGANYRPVWSHDAARIFFSSNRVGGVDQIFRMAADGTGVAERLTSARSNISPTSASSDGKTLVFQQLSEAKNYDIGILPLESDGEPEILLGTPFHEAGGVLSPDDRWLAYASDESGRSEVYVRPFRGSGERALVSTNGGVEPMWSRDGRELFYRNGHKLMAVSVSADPALSLGQVMTLFDAPFRMGTPSAQYDVAADGRLVMVGEPRTTQIHVVLDWFDELKRLAPAVN